MEDVDGNEYVDYDMGFGALFAGHMPPAVRHAIEAQLDDGTLYVTPCEVNADVAELLAERYGLPMWRFTNSGTEATMDAIRVARGVTGREKLVKVEGGYHGHHDEVMISMKPPLDKAGPADAPRSIPPVGRHHRRAMLDDIDRHPLQRRRRAGAGARGRRRRGFIVEPVMENIGICLPEPGYLEAVREITRRHGTLLDLRRGEDRHHGRMGRRGRRARRAAGPRRAGEVDRRGLPVGAFGGKAEYMDSITAGKVLHLGTYNGNPLVMAAVKAVLTEVCTPEATAEAIARNGRLVARVRRRSSTDRLPAHTVQFGAKGASRGRRARPQLPRLQGDGLRLAFAQWIRASTAAAAAPGLDEQWLISVMHDDADAMRNADRVRRVRRRTRSPDTLAR